MTIDYYEVLEVSKDATKDEIKKAYRRLAKEFHPDKCLSPEEKQISIELSNKIRNKELLSELEKGQKIQIENKVEKFIEIDKAYKVLSDQEKRKRYDNNGGYQYPNNDKDSENQQYEYNSFWNGSEEYCKNWCKLIKTGGLFTCIDLGDFERCSFLIKEGADINVRCDGSNHYINSAYLNLTPIELAIQKNQGLILDLLIKNGAKIFPSTALNSAIKFDAQKVFDFLLGRNDIDTNYQDEDGNTALHHVFKGYIDKSFDYSDSKWHLKYNSFAESLLGKGAQLDIRNNNGVTSFDLFIDNTIENKNDINFYSNAINKESIDTYLINVKQRDRLSSILGLFIKHGIDELKCRDGKPALHKLEELGFYQSYCTSETSEIPNATEKLNVPMQNPGTKLPSENRFKKRSNKKAIFYGAVGATFLTIGILAVASLYTDLRILIVAAVACILAGYCIYKVCKQKDEGVSFNLNHVSSVISSTNVENYEKKELIALNNKI